MRRSLLTASILVLLTVVPLAAGSTSTRGGALDTSFGSDGRIVQTGGRTVTALALAPDGKIAAAGFDSNREEGAYPFLAEYNPDGSAVFGRQDYGGTWNAVAVQNDGKIVVGGRVVGFTVARFDPDGSPDTTFGTDGVVSTAFGNDTGSAVNAVIVQPDGKIVAAGTASSVGQLPRFVVVRYLPDGAVDPSFGNGGIVMTALDQGTSYDYAHAAVLQPDGKIVVAGTTHFFNDEFPEEWGAIIRYNANGSLDTTFGDGGIVQLGSTSLSGLVLEPDGSLLASGGVDTFHLTKDGSTEGIVGDGGSVALDPSGKIVIGQGNTISRHMPDGSPDLEFGPLSLESTKGTVRVRDFMDRALLVEPNGRILAGGSNGRESYSEVVRLLPDSSVQLSVKRHGTGRGTVTSEPDGILCSRPRSTKQPLRSCSTLFPNPTQVTLRATHTGKSRVTWHAVCRGHRRTCTMDVNRDRSVSVTFSRR